MYIFFCVWTLLVFLHRPTRHHHLHAHLRIAVHTVMWKIKKKFFLRSFPNKVALPAVVFLEKKNNKYCRSTSFLKLNTPIFVHKAVGFMSFTNLLHLNFYYFWSTLFHQNIEKKKNQKNMFWLKNFSKAAQIYFAQFFFTYKKKREAIGPTSKRKEHFLFFSLYQH